MRLNTMRPGRRKTIRIRPRLRCRRGCAAILCGVGGAGKAVGGVCRAVSELQRRKMTAPSDPVWRKTVQNIVKEIAEREQMLVEQQQDIGAHP